MYIIKFFDTSKEPIKAKTKSQAIELSSIHKGGAIVMKGKRNIFLRLSDGGYISY